MNTSLAKQIFTRFLGSTFDLPNEHDLPTTFAILKIYINNSQLKDYYKSAIEKHNQNIFLKNILILVLIYILLIMLLLPKIIKLFLLIIKLNHKCFIMMALAIK